MVTTIDPAVELLLLMARVRPTADDETRAATLIREGVDWDYFISQANRHRVLPLVGRNLQRPALIELDRYLSGCADVFREAHLYHHAGRRQIRRLGRRRFGAANTPLPGTILDRRTSGI